MKDNYKSNSSKKYRLRNILKSQQGNYSQLDITLLRDKLGILGYVTYTEDELYCALGYDNSDIKTIHYKKPQYSMERKSL